MTVAVASMSTISAQDYSVTKLQSQPKEAETKVPMTTYAISDAHYAMPAVLANLGTHSSESNPVCNMLARHKAINEGAFLWAPLGTDVVYKDQSTGVPSASVKPEKEEVENESFADMNSAEWAKEAVSALASEKASEVRVFT